jgi:hypothetical protein
LVYLTSVSLHINVYGSGDTIPETNGLVI